MSAPPRWSVLVPTWNRTGFLDTCLRSVLAEGLGPDEMEIIVRDNASDRADVGAAVRASVGERAAFFQNPTNIGFVGNANLCVGDAHGELTHLLSDDDYVLPGFYQHIGELARSHPDAAAIAVGCVMVDENGKEIGRVELPDGVWQGADGVSQMLAGNPLQMPGVVVRRSFYERHGGFDPALVFNADWEMWLRAAYKGGVVTSSRVLAAYRVHGNNDTSRLTASSAALRNSVFFFNYLGKAYPGVNREPFLDFLQNLARNQLGKLAASRAVREYFRGLGAVVPPLGGRRSMSLLGWEVARPARALRRLCRPGTR